VMRAKFGVEIAQNSDADGVGHATIVLEGCGETSRQPWFR
jgi:hypothetical protein